MSYLALARKWRPRQFEQVVGQSHVVTALENALKNNKLHHAYLFSGTRGVGKTSLGRLFSKGLNCEIGITNQPCGICTSCVEIDQGRHVDLLEIDAASRTKVEDTRELLDNVQYKPTRGRFKIYLIDEVHMLSRHSFNALLKTLEEPPEYVKFILATTDPQKLPVTILSRCLQFHLKPIQASDIEEQLAHILRQETVQAQLKALSLISHAADGSMRDALSLTDQAIALGNGNISADIVSQMLGTLDTDQAIHLLETISHKQVSMAMQALEKLAQQGVSWQGLLKELSTQLHRIAMAQALPESLDKAQPDAEKIALLAKLLSPQDVQLFYQISLKGRQDLTLAPSGKMAIQMLLLRMLAFRPATIVAPTLVDATEWTQAPLTQEAVVLTPPVSKPQQPMENTQSIIRDERAETEESADSADESANNADKSLSSSVDKAHSATQVDTKPEQAPSTPAQAEAQNAQPMFEALPDHHSDVNNDYADHHANNHDYDDSYEFNTNEANSDQGLSDLPPEYLENYSFDSLTNDSVISDPVVSDSRASDAQSIDNNGQATKQQTTQQQTQQIEEPQAATNSLAKQLTQARHQLRSKKLQLQQGNEGGRDAKKSEATLKPNASTRERIQQYQQLADTMAEVSPPIEDPEDSVNFSDEAILSSESISSGETISSESEAQEPYQWTASAQNIEQSEQGLTPTDVKQALEHEKTPQMLEILERESTQVDEWANIVSQLPLSPLVKQIVLNAWYEKDDQQITLHLRAEHGHLNDDKYSAELNKVLNDYFNGSYQLKIVQSPQGEGRTPLEWRENLYQQKLKQAVDRLQNDPNIEKLQQMFDAQLDIDSIRPL